MDDFEEENEEGDFSPVVAALGEAARAPIKFILFWSTALGHYTMEYFSLRRAEDAWLALRDSSSVRHARVECAGQTIRIHDYDPYAWHDVRKAVGR
jgi:hypothetical protein